MSNQNEILQALTQLNNNMEKGFSDINKRIDSVEKSVQKLETTVKEGFQGIGKEFEKAQSENIGLDTKFDEDVRFLKYKVTQLEKDLFTLYPKQ